MTFAEKMKVLMEENGMWPEDTPKVMAIVEADQTNPMSGRWNDSIEGYPPGLITAVWLSVKREALKWIEANCPQAFYKPLFVD